MRDIRGRRIFIVDTETTGLDPNVDRLVEVGYVEVDLDGFVLDSFSMLCNPEMPIPAVASAVHHITDSYVQDERSHFIAQSIIADCIPLNAIIIAHNADFDRSFLPYLATRDWVCTYRLARHLYPDAPKHTNQVLRYWLDLNVDVPDYLTHRVLGDCTVTAALFHRAFDEGFSAHYGYDLDELLKFIRSPINVLKMPFGKHRGELIADIPNDYISWALSPRGVTDMDADLRYSLQAEIVQRRAAA